MWDNGNWQNCTSPEEAIRRMNSIKSELKKNNLGELLEKFQDRSCKILEIGAGDGTFLKALKSEGFNNIRGIDQETYRARENPEIEQLIEDGMIQNMRFADMDDYFTDNTYDIVVSRLVFDHDAYREQREEGFREMMLGEVHRVLQPGGFYFANEDHQKNEIIEATKKIIPRANTLVRSWTTNEFIPAKRAD